MKYKNFNLYPNDHLFFFYSKVQNFENCTQTAICSWPFEMKCDIFKVAPKWPLVFQEGNMKFKYLYQFSFVPYKQCF